MISLPSMKMNLKNDEEFCRFFKFDENCQSVNIPLHRKNDRKNMSYDFIAEFFKEKKDETPLYKTHLWGVADAASFIRDAGMLEDPDSTPGYTDYFKEVNQFELTELFEIEDNPELASILFEGKECKKIVLHAYETEPGIDIGCRFGMEDTAWVRFTGNKSESRVIISDMYSPPVVNLPLRCFKEKMGVLTLFEVMDRLQKDYRRILDEDDIKELGEDFESGLERAIDIVGLEFGEDMDLDGNPQLLHMTAVSRAGKNDDERLVGMLHDLVEDKDWTFEDLIAEGFPARTVNTLRLLTHDKQIPYMDYIRNICESGDSVALAVKMNDLNHNLKRGRAGGHWEHVAKHEKALAYIEDFMENRKEK